MWNKISAGFDRFISFLDSLAGTFVIIVTLLVCVSVFARYVLSKPIDWVVQMSEYSLLLIVFLGTTWLLKREGHVSIDILVMRLSPVTKNLLSFITSIIGILVCIIIVWYGGKTSLELFQKGTPVMGEVEIPKGVLTSIVTAGFFLLLLQFLRRTQGYFRAWRAIKNQEQR